MMITDIQTLGTDYTISDSKGNIVKTIQIIPHEQILEATVGEYDPDSGSMSDYIEASIKNLSGFENLDANKILWYATYDEEVMLDELFIYAVNHGYDKIILEHLELFDE